LKQKQGQKSSGNKECLGHVLHGPICEEVCRALEVHVAFFDHQRWHSAMSFKASWRGLLVDVAHSHWLVVVCCQRSTLLFSLSYLSLLLGFCAMFFFSLNSGSHFFFICVFSILFMGKSRFHDPGCRFGRLTHVDFSLFCLGHFYYFFFQVHPWIFGRLEFIFNLFLCFSFYRIIMVTWFRSRILQDN
jgi:hypothetical protein